MQAHVNQRPTALSAILIAPDRALAAQFCEAMALSRAFEIMLDFKTYPPGQTLDIRVRQLQPEVVLVDIGSNLEAALELIGYVTNTTPPTTVVALARQNEPGTILRTIRAGASEFLYSPFEPASTSEAIARLQRLRKSEPAPDRERGAVCVFSSVKPGCGASTLATQTAFALRRTTSKRVLLADFDLTGGTIGFYLRVDHSFSVIDALQRADTLDRSAWTSLVATAGDLDVLPAPLAPYADNVDAERVECVLEFARSIYDWVVVDLPVIFQRTSLVTIPQADRTFLVSTCELPSLNLARKAIMLFDRLGFPKDRFQIIVNRFSKRDGISRSQLEKLFGCSIYASLPNDYQSLHQVVTLGQPLSDGTDLGKAINGLATQLAGPAAAKRTGLFARDTNGVIA